MLKEMMEKPEFFYTDFGKLDRPPLIQLAFRAVHEFEETNKRSPKPRNEVRACLPSTMRILTSGSGRC